MKVIIKCKLYLNFRKYCTFLLCNEIMEHGYTPSHFPQHNGQVCLFVFSRKTCQRDDRPKHKYKPVMKIIKKKIRKSLLVTFFLTLT